MKICQSCGQSLAQRIKNCPSCGSDVADGLEYVDNYRILDVVHEGHASLLCKAIREDDETPVALRLFTVNSGVDETIAQRLSSPPTACGTASANGSTLKAGAIC